MNRESSIVAFGFKLKTDDFLAAAATRPVFFCKPIFPFTERLALS
jgi:hypothetical protein